MATWKDKNTWRIRFRFNGQLIRRTSPANTKAGSELYEVTLRNKLARGEEIGSPKEEKKQKESEQKFKTFAWKWHQIHAKTHNKQSEIKNKSYILRSKLIPFFGEIPIDKITALQIKEYTTKRTTEKTRKGKPPKNKTINNELIVLGKCLRDAQEWYELSKILKIKKLKIPPPESDFLSEEERDRFLTRSEGIWREFFIMGFYTGLRRGELIGLQWSDVNWCNRSITVRHSWSDAKNDLDTPKNNRERHIRLTKELFRLLMRRKQIDGFVFTDDMGKRIDSRQVNRKVSEVCKRAGLRNITCHVLRHTFASILAMKGVAINKIQMLLGHADIQVTMRYAHLVPSSVDEAIDALEPQTNTPVDFEQYMIKTEKQLPTKFQYKTTESQKTDPF